MATLMPQLPAESVDRIIAQVEHRADLRKCCLVCKNWLPASRHHLFRDIHITTQATYDLLVSRVLHSDHLRSHLSSVRSVSFEDHTVWPYVVGDAYVGGDAALSLFVQEFAGHLPNLARLSFTNTRWRHYPPRPGASVAFSCFPSIRELTLLNCNFPSSSTLRRALTALCSLDNLTMTDVWWPQPPVELPFLLSRDGGGSFRTMGVSSLSMTWRTTAEHRACAQHFLTWLSATSTPLSLRSLHLSVLTDTVPYTGHGYMHLLGPTLPLFCRLLSTLTITVIPHNREDYRLLLSPCLSLKTITIRLESFDLDSDLPEWARCPEILHALPAPTQLQSIEILACGHFCARPSYEGMDVLDTILEDDRFTGVKTVTITLDAYNGGSPIATPLPEGFTSFEEAEQLARSKLPRLLSRPVVKFLLDMEKF